MFIFQQCFDIALHSSLYMLDRLFNSFAPIGDTESRAKHIVDNFTLMFFRSNDDAIVKNFSFHKIKYSTIVNASLLIGKLIDRFVVIITTCFS